MLLNHLFFGLLLQERADGQKKVGVEADLTYQDQGPV
jgi:hypothetical protein